MRVHVRGAPRSGTTFFTKTLQNNFGFDTDANRKHHFVRDHIDGPVLLITKNPYAWMDSIARWSGTENKHAPQTDNELIDAWAAKNAIWMSWPETIQVRYEDLLVNYTTTLNKIGEAVESSVSDTHLIEERVSRSSNQGSEFDPGYYTESRYMKSLGKRGLRMRNAMSTHSIKRTVEALGYRSDPPGWDPLESNKPLNRGGVQL